MVLQKIIAHSGYTSRRGAEDLVRAGRVKINGKVAKISDQADPEKDKITVNNKLLVGEPPKIYLKLNKPLGYVCTNRHFDNERNIFDLVKLPVRLYAVGRLDKDSRGLVLLTNDGDLTQNLAHPRFEHEKVYEVKVRGEVRNSDIIISRFINGLDIGEKDDLARARRAKYLQNGLFVITLSEGKKRQIRRMFAAVGLDVLDLRRISLAGLSLGSLKEGDWEYLSREEIIFLKK